MTIFWAILLFACISRALADEDCGNGYYCESRFAQSVRCCGGSNFNQCCYSPKIWVFFPVAICFFSVCLCFIVFGCRRRNARARAAAAAAPSQPSNIPMTNVNTGPPPSQNNNIPYTIPASGNYYQQNVSQPQAMPMQQPPVTMPLTNPYPQLRAKSNYEGSEWE